MQIFLLPFAGGSSASFNEMMKCLVPGIEPVAIEYSGRHTRSRDGYITRYKEFLDDVVCQIKERRDGKPWALLGYSLGSVLAFDIASKNLVDDLLSHVFVCARGDLKSRSISQRYAGLDDDEFAEKIVELGGFDERLLANKRFLDIYMKPVRNDYIVWWDYSFADDGRKIPCDTSVIYCESDPLCEGVRNWDDLCDGCTDYYEMGDNHFFIRDHYADLAEIVNKKLI